MSEEETEQDRYEREGPSKETLAQLKADLERLKRESPAEFRAIEERLDKIMENL
jgi:hypothetical protein